MKQQGEAAPVRLEKRLNNNAVLAVDSRGQEYVVFGNGISFDIKKNEIIPVDKIERIFCQKEKTLLQQLIEEIPQKYFDLACEIIEYIEGNLETELSNLYYPDGSHFFYQGTGPKGNAPEKFHEVGDQQVLSGRIQAEQEDCRTAGR